eukprot:8460624-Lingulodinium_polyedra.AAC.1
MQEAEHAPAKGEGVRPRAQEALQQLQAHSPQCGDGASEHGQLQELEARGAKPASDTLQTTAPG